MPQEAIHRFEQNGKHYAIDPETCFCFECDDICWDVLQYYPQASVNEIYHQLQEKHSRKELSEVVGELEWLRASKSILPLANADSLKEAFKVDHGLTQLTVCLSRTAPEEAPAGKRGWFGKSATVISNTACETARDAVALLLNRSGEQKNLAIEFLEREYVHNPELIADLCAHALRAGRLAGKELSAAVRIADLAIDKAPAALEGHSVSVRLQFKDPESVAEHVRALSKGGAYSLSRLGKLIQPSAKGVSGAIIVRPNHPGFGEVVKTLDEAGFKHIEIDLDGAYAANPGLNPAEMLAGLGASAVYYAQCLSKGKYFRLDPIAALFYHIYEGKPRRRIDPAGLNELAIAEDGGIYPSWRMIGNEEFRVGSISEGAVDESVLNRFQDIGSVTTSVCRRCWARNLCGGGCAAVHQALSGSFRTPHGPWCEAQRVWMTAAVSAFNMLSSQGVNFTRIYQTFAGAQGGGKLSLATMMRAAFRMAIRMRPIEEHDAELLMRWENWTEAAYFLFNESGIFLATQYDREMDSLHPQGLDQEMILTKRDGAEFGLIRIRPDRAPGTAQAWIYMRDEKDYASGDVRKGIQFLLGEAGKQQSIRRVTVPAAPWEKGLQEFLLAVGFNHEGTLREALYLHGKYHDVNVYGLTIAGAS